ncbi:hypothetical protein FQN57_007491 [Myotisia sp. PD_48]|nr:hypothetical protein FQN57_007491 [Myotisia sp. PD_48]
MSPEMQSKLWTVVHPIPPIDDEIFSQVDDLAVPGAGLRALDFPTDVQSMLEGLFVPDSQHLVGNPEPILIQAPPTPDPPRVRLYGNEQDILNAYYIYIHYYFPIFPPPHTEITVDRPLDVPAKSGIDPSELSLPYFPKSPATLAISAVLALIPHPLDYDYSSPDSVLARRAYSHKFARAAIESIEEESDLQESVASPSQALYTEQTTPNRLSVHPHTPVDLEGILALLILSIYEYTQRGNLVKMRHRAGQAFVMAMNNSLHALGPEEDEFSEAKRRAWWMTYYCVCQGSIVGTTPPTIITNDPRFVTPYPRFASDPAAWHILIQAQQALVAGTQYIIDLNQKIRARADMTVLFERMKKITAWTKAILDLADAPPPPSPAPTNPTPDIEAIAAQSIRDISRIKLCSARIKTHRFRAFLDIPIFIKKHCDLTCASIGNPEIEAANKEADKDAMQKPISCCSGSLSQIQTPPSTVSGQSPSRTSTAPEASSPRWIPSEDSFPYTNFESTSICLDAALTIARMFDSLPFPTPTYEKDLDPSSIYPGFNHAALVPRTMPSFACCAMQSSYAMLMLYYKSRVPRLDDSGGPLSNLDELGTQLQNGLECVVRAVKNYSIAFEALDGMRDEIEGAYHTAFPQL